MPKKRTVMPCYGKKQQRLIFQAQIIGKQGDAVTANEMLEAAGKSWGLSLQRAAARRKKRLSTPFLPNVKGMRYSKGQLVERNYNEN